VEVNPFHFRFEYVGILIQQLLLFSLLIDLVNHKDKTIFHIIQIFLYFFANQIIEDQLTVLVKPVKLAERPGIAQRLRQGNLFGI
jgi:hypothetical protein